MVQVIFKYPAGKQERTEIVNRGFYTCDKDDFNRNEFERKFAELNIEQKKKNYLCFGQEKRQEQIFLEGTRDYEHLGIPSQYIKIRIHECDPTRFSDS